MVALGKRVDDWLWHRDLSSAGRAERALVMVLRYLFGLGRDIAGGQLSLHAMSLVYSTLLATVPLVAFSFSVLKGLNLHLEMEPLLTELVAPLGDYGRQLTEEVMGMVDKVSGRVLGGLSLTIFLYTAISMVQKVERSFNYVWHVSQPRSISRRIIDYATILLIGPLMMALALAMIASLRNNAVLQALSTSAVLGPLTVQIGKALPFVLVILLFTALYKWMPNTRVRFSSALVGGVTAGCLWALTGVYFAEFVVFSTRALIIYAGFAIAITTLLWLYANWLILLLGARLAFYFQNRAYLRIGRHDPELSSATREKLALDIMWMVGSAFRDRTRDVTIRSIAQRLSLPGIIVGKVVAMLEAAGLIAATDTEELMPAMDIHAMRVADILAAVRERGDSGLARVPRWSPGVLALGTRIHDEIAAIAGEQTLAEFLDLGAAQTAAD
ncbi:MAG: YihY/virulence factor BrkB family protein [Pseudomonadota bacterium]